MNDFLRVLICVILIQVKLQGVSSVTWLDPDDRLCLPYDFNPREEQIFARLAVIPYLDRRLLKDFGVLEIAPEYNERYNEFVSCMWKSRSLQLPDGKIDYDVVTRFLGMGIGRHLADSGPSLKLSTLKAAKFVENCKGIGGFSDGQKAIRLRNCLIPDIAKFQKM